MSARNIVIRDDMVNPLIHRWNNFGLGVHPSELELLSSPWARHHCGQRAADQTVHSNISKDGFQVCVDVHLFAPNEITVKTMDDTNVILVTAKHDERLDEHGQISRQFTRRYDLPEGFDIKDVISQLSSDGILTIKAPPPHNERAKMRLVHIEQVGPAHLNIVKKEAAEEDEKPAKHGK